MWRTLAAGDEIAGFRVESFIARGGMAVVYCARDIRLDRRVALKLLAPELSGNDTFRQRFIRESKLAASIDHPHIIPIYGAGQADDLLYLAMRYVEGTDLGGLLDHEGALPLQRALALFDQVAGALDAAHSRGLVHRDVKPGNILVASGSGPEEPDHLYLTDFGLTKRVASLSGLTMPGHFLGTLDYVAPEQITGQPVDARADVYAFGCVLYEALTGHRPFERDSDAAVIYAHLTDPPPMVTAIRPDLPREVDRIVATAMAKKPRDRYSTCQALVSALHVAAGRRTGSDRAASPADVFAPRAAPPHSRPTRLSSVPRPASPGAGPATSRPTRSHLTPLLPLAPTQAPGSVQSRPTSPPQQDQSASTDARDRWLLPLIRTAMVALTVALVYLMFSDLS